jgi:hypothetical protein
MTEEKTDIVKTNDQDNAFKLAQRQAKAYASSTMVPEQYRNNVPNTLIAMELAQRIGASVFAVMQKLYIIHGKPAFESTFLIGTVNSCGRFTPIRYKFQGQEGQDGWGCRAVATDKQTGDECVGPLVSIGMAKREGWMSKNGTKWATMPELMLMYRSAAFWTRVYAPELSMGMHTVDELNESRRVPPAQVVMDDPDDAPPPPEADPLDAVAATLEAQQGATQEAEDEFNIHAEVMDMAKDLYGKDAQKRLKSICKDLGLSWASIDEAGLGKVLDILIAEKERANG